LRWKQTLYVKVPIEIVNRYFMTEYLWAVQDDHCRWGFINSKGIVIPPQFDGVCDFSEGLAGVQVGDQWGFINHAGEMVIPPQFDDCAGEFSEGLASVRIGYKWGAIDPTGNLVIPLQFDLLCMFSEGLAIAYIGGTVRKKWNDRQLEIHKMQLAHSYPDDEVEAAKEYEKDVNQLVIDGGRWGVVDKTGTFVISPRFNMDGERDLEDSFRTKKGFKHGILKFRASDLIAEEPEMQSQETRKYGMINRYGDIVVEPVWDEIYEEWHDDLLRIRNQSAEEDGIDEHVFLKPGGEIAFTNSSLSLRPFFYDGMVVATNKEGLKGYMNTHGELVIDCQFQHVGNFSEGLAYAICTEGLDEESSFYGYIDKTGQMVIPEQFVDANEFLCNGLAVVETPDGKCGLIDKMGQFVLPPKYDWLIARTDNDDILYEFGEGEGDSTCGVIDSRGNIIAEPIYRRVRFGGGIIEVELEGTRDYEPKIYFNRAGEVIFKSTPA
jgi:WG containing repeat